MDPSYRERIIRLVAEGSLAYLPELSADPFADLVELMEVVERLCPRAPQRPLPIGHDYRL